MEWLWWTAGVVLFLIILMVSVGLHEAGHMVAAKKLGVKVPEFFVGFGQKIWSFKRNGTEYGFRWIPAGGYVRLVDESVEEGNPERELLSRIAPWKRQIIFAAGPAVNIVLGFAIVFGTLLGFAYEQPSATIKAINSCSAEEKVCGAEIAGIEPGDEVLSIDGKEIAVYSEIGENLKSKEAVTMEVLRDGKTLEFDSVPIVDDRFGVNLDWELVHRTPGEAVTETGVLVKNAVTAVLKIPEQIPGIVATVFQGAERDPESVGSVVGAGKTYGDVAATDKLEVQDKARVFLLIAGALNLSVGFLNLLPFPPLDGGKMVFAAMDSLRKFTAKLRRKEYTPTPYKWIKIATILPAIVVICVMALLIAVDIVAPITII